MILVISATNRPDNNTVKIARKYVELLQQKGADARLFSLEELPADFICKPFDQQTEVQQEIVKNLITPAEKLVIISPEYNGSFPGILKVFIDNIPPKAFKGKRVALVGVASGRAGNLRGMDHLTGILHYLDMEVLPNKLPVSRVDELLDVSGELVDESTIKALEKQIESFIQG